MLQRPFRFGQPFHCLETDVSAGMGTASEEPLGLYREGDSDGASRVTHLRGLLYLPEALGANHDGKAPAPVDHPDPSPDHLRPARRTDKALPEPEGRPSSTPCVRKSQQRSHRQPGPIPLVRRAPGSRIFSRPRQTTTSPRPILTCRLYIVGK
jgi:hypothetical protein